MVCGIDCCNINSLALSPLSVLKGRVFACSLLNYIYRFIQSCELYLCVALMCDRVVDGRHKQNLFFFNLFLSVHVVPVGNCLHNHFFRCEHIHLQLAAKQYTWFCSGLLHNGYDSSSDIYCIYQYWHCLL